MVTFRDSLHTGLTSTTSRRRSGLEVTGLPAGVYYLPTTGSRNHWVESRVAEPSNFVGEFGLSRKVLIRRSILDHSACAVPAQCGFGGNRQSRGPTTRARRFLGGAVCFGRTTARRRASS
jgi:hypothetical protein